MVKSPIEYFESQSFDARSATPEMSPKEISFIQKYMGIDPSKALASIPVVIPEGEPSFGGTSSSSPMPVAPSQSTPMLASQTAPSQVEIVEEEYVPLDNILKESSSIQLVGFYVDNQTYALPTLAIQEVIRAQEISLLPMAPDFVSGVINLRGHITPLINMRLLLGIPQEEKEKFIIVCRCQGLQFGLQIDQLQTMHRVNQEDINWNAEASIGADAEFIIGLFEVTDRLIPIMSIDKLVEALFKD